MKNNIPHTKKKLHNIQSLRGVAVLLVLFFHVMLMEKKWSGGERILSDFMNTGQTGVDLFFIISGFVMTTITVRKFQNRMNISGFIYNRLSRIYPLYWFYSFILLVVYFIRPNLVNPSLGGRINIIESFLLIPQDTLPLLMVGWTLIYEMYFYFLFTIFLIIPEKHFIKVLLLWFGAIIAGNMVYNPAPHVSWVSTSHLVLSPFAFEFIFGCIVARIIAGGVISKGKIVLGTGLFLLAAISCFFFLYPEFSALLPWTRVFIFGIPYAMIVYGSVSMEMKNRTLIFTSLQKIGYASFSIYLSHSLVINATGWMWTMFRKRWPVFDLSFLWILIMLLMSIAFGLMSYRLIEVPLMSAAKRISDVSLAKFFPNKNLYKQKM